MRYDNILEARFLDRPNRFIANVELGGETRVCHVKNTGRCRELLVPGARVWVRDVGEGKRRTRYDLICVDKSGLLINIDSAAPNAAFRELLERGGLIPSPTLVRPETRFMDSRFDFYLEAGERRAFCEVKGVTLEDRGTVRFPDAPTSRGTKHLRELVRAKKAGYEAFVAFVIQMAGAERFEPNGETDPDFARALRDAARAGVEVLAYGCRVEPDLMEVGERVPVVL